MKYKKLNNQEEIYKKLIDFLDVFNDLRERVGSITIYSNKLNNNAECYVMINKGKEIGFMAFYANNINCCLGYVSLIGIKENYRCKGYGHQLLNYCCTYLKRIGMKKVQLEVSESNIAAIQFYKKNGFKRNKKASQQKTFYMEKTL